MAAKKRRCTYSKELRAEQKMKQGCLVTISVEFPNKELLEEQGVVDIKAGQFTKWIMAKLFCPEVKNLPDLETYIRERLER